MATTQGPVTLLEDPVAKDLLQSRAPARFAYVWRDGTPRVVPIWFHWNGKEIVLGTASDAPKMKVLRDGAKVALTIESETADKALLIRGTIRLDLVDGVAPEYAAMAQRVEGDEAGQAWVAQIAIWWRPHMARIFIRPEWVGILDFETRFPSAIERGMARAQADS
jgi:hypothetical protein